MTLKCISFILILFLHSNKSFKSYVTHLNYRRYHNTLDLPSNFYQYRLYQARNIEQELLLDKGIKPDSFLTNIIEYGKNRMARRAVGVLQKMPAYRTQPSLDHYNAALWACENSLSFQMGIALFMEMRNNDIELNVLSYESLIVLAEKTGNFKDSIDLFREMRASGIKGNTRLYNSCLWSCNNNADYELALEFLNEMESDDIPRDAETYAAILMACEAAGNGKVALRVKDYMLADNIELTSFKVGSIMWACVKDNMSYEALSLFNNMTSLNLVKDVKSYNAAIWSCIQNQDKKQAIEYLRLMKFEGIERNIESFLGVFKVLQLTNDWENIQEILKWIDRDGIKHCFDTYSIAITVFDQVGMENVAKELYARALREHFISPWVSGTRIVDLRGLNLSLCKITMLNILNLMREKKLPSFDLSMILYDIKEGDNAHNHHVDDSVQVDHHHSLIASSNKIITSHITASVNSIEVDLENYLRSLNPIDVIFFEKSIENQSYMLKISRDILMQWIGGYSEHGLFVDSLDIKK